MRGTARTLLLVAGTSALATALAWAAASRWLPLWDMDADGTPDSIESGASRTHILWTVASANPATPPGSRFTAPPRLYGLPPAYVDAIAEKSFHYSREWDLVKRGEPGFLVVCRRNGTLRAFVKVDDWQGQSLVRVWLGRGRVRETDGAQAAQEVFRVIEWLLFQGLPTRSVVVGFDPAQPKRPRSAINQFLRSPG